jgi:hypothetical protein
MHRRIPAIVSAAAVALGVSGCLHSQSRPAPTAALSTTVTPSSAAAPTRAPLPPPEALTEVLYRLADPALPGLAKLHLVEGSRPDDAPVFDKFAGALLNGGFAPPTFNASDIAWSDRDPSDVTATVNVTGPDRAATGFTFPMEFKPHEGGWQLSQQTAAMLLAFDTSRPSPSPSPTP